MSFVRFSFNQSIYNGFVTEVSESYFILNSKGEKLYTHYKNHQYEIGDYLQIKGHKEDLSFSTLESSFDFENYLNNKGIYKELVSESISFKFKNPIRLNAYKKSFISKFDSNTASIVSSILFSDRIDSDLTDGIENLHLSRLLSTSGIYIYLFLSIIEFFLNRKLKEKWSKIISIGLLSTYLVFTFPRFTVIKIIVLSIARWINRYYLNRKFENEEVIGIVGFAFLLFDYHLAYQDSFILGFSLPIVFMLFKEITRTEKKWKEKIKLAILAYIFFIPFELKYYHSIEPFSSANQMIFTPYFLLLGVISLLAFYGLPIYKLVNWLTYPLKFFLKPFNAINIEIYAPEFNRFGYLVYYVLFFAFFYYLSIGFKPVYRKILAISSLLLIYYLVPVKNLITQEVDFINVGQGDACLIRNQNKTIMIDTGGLKYMDVAKESLIPYFKKKQIYQIDLVITTHDDSDHKGALKSLTSNFTVEQYIYDYKCFPLTYAGIKFVNYNKHIDAYTDDNAKSLVIGFHAAKKDFLVTGDAPIEVEKAIIKENKTIPCNVLKIGHHGSKTSTCDEFIKFLNPKEAIISVGKNNYYGHPNKPVLEILTSNNVPYKRTDEVGTITYWSFSF